MFKRIRLMFERHPMLALRFAACLTLCAVPTACTTLSLETRPVSPCMKILLGSGLLDPTPSAAISLIDGTAGGLGSHDVAQTGQLVKANIDKATAKKIGTSCDAEWAQALKDARPKHWYQFWR